eukprot:9989579-Alexandrium_andersonii.AAC.1
MRPPELKLYRLPPASANLAIGRRGLATICALIFAWRMPERGLRRVAAPTGLEPERGVHLGNLATQRSL